MGYKEERSLKQRSRGKPPKKVYSKQATRKLAISGWKQLQNIKNREITMTTDS